MTMIQVSNFVGAFDQDVVANVIAAEAAHLMPIYAMMQGTGQVAQTDAEEPKWYGSRTGLKRTQINNAGLDAASAAIIVDDSSVFAVGDIIISESTGEAMQVQSIINASTVAVLRGLGSSVASDASVADNVWFLNLGRAAGEGAGSPPSSSAGKTQYSNLLQTFREAVELSGRLQRVKTVTEDERGFQRRTSFKQFIINIEMALLHGTKSTHTDVDGNRVTTMAGLRQGLVDNVVDIGGLLTVDGLEAAASQWFATGSDTKVAYAGSTVMGAVTKLWRDKIRLAPADGRVGLRVREVETSHGLLQLVPHRGLVGVMSGDAIVVDQEQVRLRHTNGGLPIMLTDTEAKGVDGSRDEWFAELSLEYGETMNHGQLLGVTGA